MRKGNTFLGYILSALSGLCFICGCAVLNGRL